MGGNGNGMLPSGMGVGLAAGAGEEPGCAFMSGIGVGIAGSGSGMVPSGRGVGLAEGLGFGVAVWPGVGEETGGMVGNAPGAGNGARVGSGAGVPMGAIEGRAPGVGKPAREFVWPYPMTSEATNTPPQIKSFFNVGM